MAVEVPAQIRAEVAKITASPGFARSERLIRFLRLIVEETLAGRGDDIKEYLIGTQVYARPQDYDPRVDATVRVEATKLRKRLTLYYDGEGREDAVVIRIPKGCYRPEFEHRTANKIPCAVAVRSRRPVLIASICVSLVFLAAVGMFVRLSTRGPRLVHQRLISTFAGSQRSASFSPDGAMIAFVSSAGGVDGQSDSQVWVKDLSEGSPIQITFGGTDAARPIWSPRGDQIFFERREQGIWSVPPLGGPPPHRIIEDGRQASISQDGSHLLFVRRRELWTAAADGSEQRRLEGVPERFFPMQTPPAFSPDGRSIAFFNAEVGPHGDIWVIPATGGHPRQITFDQAETRGLVWSQDGRWILFSSLRAGSCTLWRVSFAGGVPEPVTTGAGEDIEPAISAKGRNLVYTNVRTTWSLMLLDPASGSQKELFSQRQTIGFPSFSPDGQRIAFFQPVDGDPHLFLVATNSGERVQISRGHGWEISPVWSDDGSSLYFYQIKPEVSFRKLTLSGGASIKVAGWVYGKQNWARVDASGRRAVYTEVGPKGPLSTLVRNLTTGHEQALAVTLTRSQWSPDGEFILGESGSRENAGGGRVTICRSAGNDCREVTKGLAPKWSAGGMQIYFLRRTDRPGLFDLWSASGDGTDQQRITTLGPFRADGVNFDISRDGRIVWAPANTGRQELWLAELH